MLILTLAGIPCTLQQLQLFSQLGSCFATGVPPPAISVSYVWGTNTTATNQVHYTHLFFSPSLEEGGSTDQLIMFLFLFYNPKLNTME